jgi:hypothetical protein
MRRVGVFSAAVAVAVGSAVVVSPGVGSAAGGAPPRVAGGSVDFNGDGFEDLAVGAPGATVADQVFAGSVLVAYGSASGVDPAAGVRISQDGPEVPGDPVESARFGAAVAAGDVNGDGFTDLAVGAVNDTDTGSVTMLFGSAAGLGGAVRMTGAEGEHLGVALVAADMDGNGRPELVASSYTRLVRFTVKRGGRTPVRTADVAEGYNGTVLAAGDMDNDGRDDLFSFYSAVGGTPTFTYFPGSRAGLATSALVTHYEGGVAAAVGDLNGDGYADLVVGRPVEVFAQPLGGEITIWYGSRRGLRAAPNERLTQDSGGVPDVAEEQDYFGSAVAIGDMNGDSHPDLAVGAQYEGVGDVVRPGAVTVLLGNADGLTTGGAWYAQGEAGTPGTPASYDQFGWATAFGDFDDDGRDDLAIGAVGENGTQSYPYYGDGAVTILPGNGSDPTVLPGGPGDRLGWTFGL